MTPTQLTAAATEAKALKGVFMKSGLFIHGDTVGLTLIGQSGVVRIDCALPENQSATYVVAADDITALHIEG